MGKLNPKRIKNNQISVKVVDLKELDMCKKGAGMVSAKRGWYGMCKKGPVWYVQKGASMVCAKRG